MSQHVHSFAERHPGKRETIHTLADSSSAFNDLCARFGRVWDSLNELENEPVDTEKVRREVTHLETEMLSIFQSQMRV